MPLLISSIHLNGNRNSDFQEYRAMKNGVTAGEVPCARSSAYAQPLLSDGTWETKQLLRTRT